MDTNIKLYPGWTHQHTCKDISLALLWDVSDTSCTCLIQNNFQFRVFIGNFVDTCVTFLLQFFVRLTCVRYLHLYIRSKTLWWIKRLSKRLASIETTKKAKILCPTLLTVYTCICYYSFLQAYLSFYLFWTVIVF